MARARNIKPKFFQNDELGELHPLARLLFIGMWTIADFKGCLEFRPKRIKTQILPYDECDIEQLTNSLDKSGFISIYSVQDRRYIKIIKFAQHQTPHKNEREAGSEIPDMDENNNGINELKEDGINPDKNGTTRAESLFPLPDSLFLNPEPGTPPAPAQKVRKPSPSGDDVLFPGVEPQVVADFKALRKQKRAPITPTAIAKIVKEAEIAGITLEAALTLCCSRGWQGFEAAWLERRGTPRVDGAERFDPTSHVNRNRKP